MRFQPALSQVDSLLHASLIPLLDDNFEGFIEQRKVQQLLLTHHLTIDKLMLALLPIATSFSQPRISGFEVGAIALCDEGNLYMGANLELAQLPLNHSVHAEQSAISHAWLRGAKKLVKIAINYSPCGHCRQFINETFEGAETLIILPKREIAPLKQYLPYGFSPKDLGKTEQLLNSKAVDLHYDSEDPLVISAIDAANNSYAPYSGNYAGVALEMVDQRIFTGRVAENAAYNPSLMPMHVALSALNRSGYDCGDIQRAVLVESSDGKLSLANNSLDALHSVTEIELEHLVL
ncbi:cytidine deaminase [Paraferrimonas sp. SM1919]|uniref:cytidine deaminase n=1 Tax=Paraferrimonas sp. SM1919 TaxID=2662263 RepID=UPI001F09999D|nr:cytidine deaminase [Paraferrimonas sp. SM1919]